MPKNKQVERIAEKVEAKRRKLQLRRLRRQNKKTVLQPTALQVPDEKPSKEELLKKEKVQGKKRVADIIYEVCGCRVEL